MAGTYPELNGRERSVLFAVSAGRAEMTCSSEPDLFIDGLFFCDQFTAHRLAHFGLVAPSRPGKPGEHVMATLTASGRTLVGAPGEPVLQDAA